MIGFCQKASRNDRLSIDCIRTGHIQCNRVKGCKESHIRNNGSVIFSMAVTVRGNVDDQRNMEIRTSVDDSLGVFGDLAVQDIIGFI